MSGRGGPFSKDGQYAENAGAVAGTALALTARGLFRGGKWIFEKLNKEPEPPRPKSPPLLSLVFEHTHLVAGSGFGKTQALQTMILRDLPNIAEGWKTTIVIDSQGDLIKKILQLQALARPELSDRIILIDPHDVEVPPCLNLFDFGMERLRDYKPVDQERITNSAIQMFTYIFSQLLGAEMTQRQSVVFENLAQLLIAVPNATVFTLMMFLEKPDTVTPYLHLLDQTTRHFLTTHFFSSAFDTTRRQILTRIWGVVTKKTIGRLFSHQTNKIDMFAAMNRGSLILINTAKELLGQQGTELFGRFMIALIAQATQERATLPENERTATLIYIDEAQDYFDNELVGIQQLLNQGRKYRVGLTLAHQHLGQLPGKLRDTVMASTANKFVGGLSQDDAAVFAKVFGVPAEDLLTLPTKTSTHVSFACYVRSRNPQIGRDDISLGRMEQQPRMTEGEYETLRTRNRERYCAPVDAQLMAGVINSAGPGTTLLPTDFELADPGRV